MIAQIIETISSLKDITYNEIIPGNIRIGEIETENNVYDFRFLFSESYETMLLIDDIWEPIIVKSQTSINKIDIYIVHNDIKIKQATINILPQHAELSHYHTITKYFIHLNDLPIKLQDKLSLNNSPITLPLKKHKPTTSLSIVTTVFNNALMLEQTIQSVIHQSQYNECEYIIKDADSNDNFNIIKEKYSPYIDIIISQKDKGIYDGMEEGVRSSHGEYFMILNSDDIFSNRNVIKNYIKNISTNKDFYFANLLTINNKKYRIHKSNIKQIWRKAGLKHSTLLCKTQLFFGLGGFNKNLKISADWFLFIDLKKNKLSFQYLEEFNPIIFRTTGTSSAWNIKQLKENIICCLHYNPFNIIGVLINILIYIKAKIK